jgi:D-galactarolactone cycloisomerase
MNVKIAKVEAFPLAYTLDVPCGDGTVVYARRQTTLVKITTDGGLYGWGQGGRADVVRTVFAPLLLGEDPRDTGRLWQRLFKASGSRGAVGAVDVALWDLKGKLTGMAVAQLLGGAVRDRVPAYASLHNYTPTEDLGDELVAALADARGRGFTAIKMKVGGRCVKEDLRYVRLAREVVGPDVDLMADANQTYAVPAAIKVGRTLEELDFAWYEEPIPTFDVAGYAHLHQTLDIALAAYEGIGDPAQIAPVLRARAVDLYQPDLVGAGGFTVLPHLVAMAAAFGVGVTAHCWDSAITQVGTLHLLATIPSWHARSTSPLAPPLEVTTTPRHPLNTELLLDPPLPDGEGCFAVPDRPGLGIEVNPDTLVKYAADR